MRKLGVKTSKYANTELYTCVEIMGRPESTTKLDGLKYGFERNFQFYALDVPGDWIYNSTGEYEKRVTPMCIPANRLTTWEDIEAYFATCTGEDE